MIDLSLLVGRQLEQVARHDGSWGFTFTGGVALRVDCLWRVTESGRLLLTSEDHGHRFGLPAAVDGVAELQRRFVGTSVTSATVREGGVDIALAFSCGAAIEVIATSAGYEAWVLSGQGVLMVGQPGHE